MPFALKKKDIKTAAASEAFFGIVKSGTKGDRIGVIDKSVVGETIGFFMKYDDGRIDKFGEIKVDIDLPKEFDPKKVKLRFVAEGEKKEPRDLKGYKPDEVQVQAFYGDKPLDEALLPLKQAELVFPEAQPPAPPDEPPTPPASSGSASSKDDNKELTGSIILFYHPGEPDEQIVNTVGEVKFWLRALELGLVAEADFGYRETVEVMGGVKIASPNETGIPFKAQNLKQILSK